MDSRFRWNDADFNLRAYLLELVLDRLSYLKNLRGRKGYKRRPRRRISAILAGAGVRV